MTALVGLLGKLINSPDKFEIRFLLVLFWCVWNERNRIFFDAISTPNHSRKARCLSDLCSWDSLSPVGSH